MNSGLGLEMYPWASTMVVVTSAEAATRAEMAMLGVYMVFLGGDW